MPNPTTIYDAAQTVLREIEIAQNMASFKVGRFRFDALPLSEHQRQHTPRMEVISSYDNEYIDESDATKLVAMILQVFPNIREQINESKP